MYAVKLEYNKIQEYNAKIDKLKSEQKLVKEKKKFWKRGCDNKNIDNEDNNESISENIDEDELILNEQINDYLDVESDEDEDQENKYEPVKVTTNIVFNIIFF